MYTTFAYLTLTWWHVVNGFPIKKNINIKLCNKQHYKDR